MMKPSKLVVTLLSDVATNHPAYLGSVLEAMPETANEKRILMYLLLNPQTTTEGISEATRVKLNTTYINLYRLEAKGLVVREKNELIEWRINDET